MIYYKWGYLDYCLKPHRKLLMKKCKIPMVNLLNKLKP